MAALKHPAAYLSWPNNLKPKNLQELIFSLYCDGKRKDRFIIQDTEKQNDVRLGNKLGLTATMDITLKQTF